MGELSYTVGGDSNLVSFKSAARVPITSLKAHFKPKQDLHGYSKPWPAGGGKNLYDASKAIPRNGYLIEDNGVERTSTMSGYDQNLTKVKPNTTYAFQGKVSAGWSDYWYRIYFYDNNKNFISRTDILNNYVNMMANYIFTTPSNCEYVTFQYHYDYINFATIQIEEGSTITSYEPYENICPIEGWNSTKVWLFSNNLMQVTPTTSVQFGMTWTADENGIVTYEGTPTSYAGVRYGKVYLNGRTKLYGRIFGDESNVAFNTLWVYDSSGTRIATISQPWENTTHTKYVMADLSNYPTASYVTVALKRFYDGIYMKGTCYAVVTDDPQYLQIPVTFPSTGKNLFNLDTATTDAFIRADNVSSENPLGQIVYDRQYYVASDFISVLPSTTYTAHHPFHSIASAAGMVYYDANKIPISGVSIYVQLLNNEENDNNYTFVTPDNCYYVRISYDSRTGNEFQLEQGNTATVYEPYSSNNTFYGGYIDIAAGEIVKEYDSYTFTGSEDDQLSYYNTSQYYGIERHLFRSTKLDWLPKYSSTELGYYSTAISVGNVTSSDYISAYIGTPIHQIIFTINSSACENTVESFSAWLSEHPLQIVYPLKDPIHIPIPKSELTTFLNVNTAWSNTNDTTEVSYAIHDTAPIRAAKQRMIAFAAKKEEEIRVPSAYRKLQYISAVDSNPYITTSVTYPNELEAEVHFYNTKTEAFVFGARNDISKKPYCNLNISSEADKIRFDYGDYKYHVSTTGKTGEKIFKFHNRVATMIHVDTSTTKTYSYDTAVFTSYTSNPLLLFAVNTNGSPSLGDSQGELRMYSAKFWVGGKLVGNFLPCKRKSDDVVGMYDTITKQFYTSTNTDTFTAGSVA